MELQNVKNVSVSGGVQVTLPHNFVVCDDETVQAIIASGESQTKAIAAGMLEGEVAVVTGALDVWSWSLDNVSTRDALESPVVAPVLGGIMVLIVDKNSNMILVPTAEIIAGSTHALNSSELQLPTYNHDKDDAG